jgi:hypothetical protein
MLNLIKSKLILYGGAVLVALLGIIKYLSFSKGVWKDKAKKSMSALKRHEEVQEIDSELSKDLQSKKAEIVKEIKSGEEVTSLSDPNDWD